MELPVEKSEEEILKEIDEIKRKWKNGDSKDGFVALVETFYLSYFTKKVSSKK